MTGAMTFIDLIVDGEALGLALAEKTMPLRVPFFEFTESEHYRELVTRARREQSLTRPQLQNLEAHL